MGILTDWQIERDIGIKPFAKGEKRPGQVSSGLSSYGYDARLGHRFKVFKPYPCTDIDPKRFDERLMETVDLTPLTCNWKRDDTGPKGGRYEFYCSRCGGGADTPHDLLCKAQPPNFLLIPPHSFALGESLETFYVPRDVLCVVVGKSTYARCGIIINVTPLEPEWRGVVTIEISNTTPLPARVYCGEGVMQCMFFRSDGHSELDRESLSHIARMIVSKTGGRVKSEEETAAWLKENGSCRVSYADKRGRYQNQTGVTPPTVDGEK